jgi:hypothetical protein
MLPELPESPADRIISSVEQWSAVQQDDLTLLICDLMSANADVQAGGHI